MVFLHCNFQGPWWHSSIFVYYQIFNKLLLAYDLKIKEKSKIIQQFGGELELINSNDFTMLRPPLETRCNTFEKSYKIKQNVYTSSIYQKLLDDSDELVLKRSKPLKSSQYSLDKTLLIKKKKKEQKN